jgi:hypothetical protein
MSESHMLPPGPFTRQQAEAVTRRYHNIALKMTRAVTSAWWFVTLKVEWSGGRGALNRMPVKGLTVISASQASSEHPPPDHTHSSSLHVLYFPYASHRRWRFY